MVYEVYTDGAFKSGGSKIGLSYVVVTNDKFLRMRQYSSNGTSAAKAEIIALGLAVTFLLSEVELKADDSIILYTDSVYAMEYFMTGQGDPSEVFTQDKRVKAALRNYQLLVQKADVRFQKVLAHANGILSGNKLADRLAKYAIASA